ncbi:MAG: ATPase [Anaerolineaceae bacterium]|nr:ATPase [Anaerolineaceae bacterium]
MSSEAKPVEQIVIERTFDAPRVVIWQMWTEPEHFSQWYGPTDFTIPICEIDLQEDGKRLFCMQSPDGMQMWFTGTYKEISPIDKLVYTESMADAEGNVVGPDHYGMPADAQPLETIITVILDDLGDKTRMTMTHAGIPAGSPGEMGWNMAFDKLAAVVADRA